MALMSNSLSGNQLQYTCTATSFQVHPTNLQTKLGEDWMTFVGGLIKKTENGVASV